MARKKNSFSLADHTVQLTCRKINVDPRQEEEEGLDPEEIRRTEMASKRNIL
jgi:hypothetical protein